MFLILNIYESIRTKREPGGSVSIMSKYGLDDRAIEVRSPAEIKDFSSSLCVQADSALVQRVPGVKRGRA
jgi:hypothetical protein